MAKAKFNPLVKKLSGNIGDLIICRHRGRTYLRSRVTPRNPRTEKQTCNRDKFTLAVQAWQDLSETEKDKYRYRARRKRYYGYNLFISEYMYGKVELSPSCSDPVALSVSHAIAVNKSSNLISGKKTGLNLLTDRNIKGRRFIHNPDSYET